MVLSDYQAMRLMPLGDEAVMAYTSIIFTVLLARIFLGEPCSREKLLCSFCIVVGVALISSPAAGNSSYPNYGLGCALTILGALCDAASYIFIKELSALPCSVILISCGIASMVVTGPLSLIEAWTMPKEPISLTTITLLTFFHDIFIILALRAEEAGLVSLVQASDIVFSYIWELIFFEEPYSFQRVLGAGLVSSAVCVAALVERTPSVSLLERKELPLFLKTTDSKLRYEIGLRAEEVFKWLHLRER
nr:solute carrier family 35 member G1-like [Halyomorpha halys]